MTLNLFSIKKQKIIKGHNVCLFDSTFRKASKFIRLKFVRMIRENEWWYWYIHSLYILLFLYIYISFGLVVFLVRIAVRRRLFLKKEYV